MTEEREDPAGLTLPIQPTGSGVVDLEIAREQAALADDASDDQPRAAPDDQPFGDVTASGAE